MTVLKESAEGRINALKQLLANSDYKAIKFAEGRIGAEEYAPVREKRERLREIIRELEETEAETEDDCDP